MDQEIYPGGNPPEQDARPAGASTPPPAPAIEQDRMPGGPSRFKALGALKSQKWLLFALMGLAGGAGGALLGQVAPPAGDKAKLLEVAVKTGIWAALAASVIAVFLFWANDIYNRQRFGPRSAQRGLLTGLIGGFIAGCLAEVLFQLLRSNAMSNAQIYLIYGAGWAALGLLLGVSFSRTVPNMGIVPGILAGLTGGAIGGVGFVFLSGLSGLSELLALMVGVGTLGFSLGLAIVVIESVFREASLEVQWSANENSFFNLGPEPIYIGGGREDHVYVRGLGERHSHVVFKDGAIEYVDAESQKRTPLKNGSSLQIGALKLIVHAAK